MLPEGALLPGVVEDPMLPDPECVPLSIGEVIES